MRHLLRQLRQRAARGVDAPGVHSARRAANRLRRHGIVGLLWRTGEAFTHDRGSLYAAAITYYALFALLPLLTLIVSVIGLVIQNPNTQARMIEAIVLGIPEGGGIRDELSGMITGVSGVRHGVFGLIAAVGAAWTATGLVGTLRTSLDHVFKVSKRPFIEHRVRDMLTVFAMVGLVLLSSGLSTLLSMLREAASRRLPGDTVPLDWIVISALLPVCISSVVFLLVYRLIPNHTLGWSELWIGAVVAAIGFEMARFGFGLYVSRVARFDEVYGPLGTAFALLFFIFIVANLLILAAELNAVLADDRAAPYQSRRVAATTSRTDDDVVESSGLANRPEEQGPEPSG